jgi:hypothetical protein
MQQLEYSGQTDFHKMKQVMTIMKEKYPDRVSWLNMSMKRLPDVKVIKIDESWLVRGLPPGDTQPWYLVRNIDGSLLCPCYYHSFGKMRKLRMCTHTGAVLLYACLTANNMEDIFKRIELSEKTLNMVYMRKSIAKTISEKFSDSRSAANITQALNMVPDVITVDESTWKVSGFSVRMVDGKYFCLGPEGLDKFPCRHAFAVMIHRREKRMLVEGEEKGHSLYKERS